MSISKTAFNYIYYCNESILEMREKPVKNSKVVSQAVFAERIEVERAERQWSYITTPDGYQGWVLTKHLVPLNFVYLENQCSVKVSRLAVHIYKVKDIEYGPFKTLPYGIKLQVIDQSDSRWIQVALPDDAVCYIQKGDVEPESACRHKKDLVEFSKKFLGLPYTWGGRSSFGYDCSGFVQELYKQIGVGLQRDSRQQVLDLRFKTINLEDLEPGDLIFFGKSANEIKHVALALGEAYFIHATARENKPYIRISRLSDFEWSGHAHAYYPYRVARQLAE